MRTKQDAEKWADNISATAPEDGPTGIERAKLDVLDWLSGFGDCITDDECPIPATPEDADAVIAKLEAARASTPARSAFGDDNWGQLDAQIAVLRWYREAK